MKKILNVLFVIASLCAYVGQINGNIFGNHFPSADELAHELATSLEPVLQRHAESFVQNGVDYIKKPDGQKMLKELAEVKTKANIDALASLFKSGSSVDSQIKQVLGYGLKKILPLGVAGVVGLYGSFKLLQFCFDQVTKHLASPYIVGKTNATFTSRIKRTLGLEKDEKIDIIFDPRIGNKLAGAVKGTAKVREAILNGDQRAVYRNLLLFGPPGTGKTLIARLIAIESGMDYVEIPAGTLINAGEQQIRKLQAWAESISGGLLIFIDEVDALFPNRANLSGDKKEEMLATINAMYAWMGTPSNKVMFIGATNLSFRMDDASDRRFPDKLMIPLPDESFRFTVLKHNRDTRLLADDQEETPFIESVKMYLSDEKLKQIAARTEGLSNADLFYIIDNMKYKAMSETLDEKLSPELVDSIVNDRMEYHTNRQNGTLKF